MLHSLKKILVQAIAIALPTLCIAASAHAAQTVDVHYGMPAIGEEWDYRAMGYADANGNFVDLAGSQITSSTVSLDFTPDDVSELDTLVMAMVVPETGGNSQYFVVHGSDMVETSQGTWHYDLTTDDFNGTIYSGSFSVESYGMDADGNPISLPGSVGAGSGFSYTVALASAVPEPTSASLLLAGLMAAPLFARRKKKAA